MCFEKKSVVEWRAAVERMRHIQDTHGHIMALTFRSKEVDHFKLLPLLSEAVTEKRTFL